MMRAVIAILFLLSQTPISWCSDPEIGFARTTYLANLGKLAEFKCKYRSIECRAQSEADILDRKHITRSDLIFYGVWYKRNDWERFLFNCEGPAFSVPIGLVTKGKKACTDYNYLANRDFTLEVGLDFPVALLRDTRKSPIEVKVGTPLHFGAWSRRNSVDVLLDGGEDKATRFLGIKEIQGAKCLVFEVEYLHWNATAKAFLDPAKGCFARRIEWYDGTKLDEIACITSFREAGDGVWFPERCVYIRNPSKKVEESYSFSDYQVIHLDTKTPDDVFRITVPAGAQFQLQEDRLAVFIHDKDSTVRVTELKGIKQALDKSSRFYKDRFLTHEGLVSDDQGETGTQFGLALVSILLIGVGCVFVFVRRYWRKQLL